MAGEFSLFGVREISGLQRKSGYQALTRSGNQTETLDDDQICITSRGCESLNGDCNYLTRTNRYSGDDRIRLLPSGRKFGNCNYTNSANCCRSRDSGRDGIRSIYPFIKERTRNYNQTLVGAGRPPPAARGRCSHVHVCISARS